MVFLKYVVKLICFFFICYAKDKVVISKEDMRDDREIFGYGQALIMPLFWLLINNFERTSSYIMQRYGYNGSHYLIPLVGLDQLE